MTRDHVIFILHVMELPCDVGVNMADKLVEGDKNY